MRRWRAIAVTAAAALFTPGLAQAHLVVTGMGPIYDGITHFALSPEDSLPVIALALYAGLRGPRPSRRLLGALPAAWFIGGLLICLTGLTPPPTALPIATALLFLGVGGLLAANPDLSARDCAIAAIALGLVTHAIDAVHHEAALEKLANGETAEQALEAFATPTFLPRRSATVLIGESGGTTIACPAPRPAMAAA